MIHFCRNPHNPHCVFGQMQRSFVHHDIQCFSTFSWATHHFCHLTCVSLQQRWVATAAATDLGPPADSAPESRPAATAAEPGGCVDPWCQMWLGHLRRSTIKWMFESDNPLEIEVFMGKSTINGGFIGNMN